MDKICETDPWYTDVKRFKKEEARRLLLADGCDGIPTNCPCGARIVAEPSHLSGSDVGRTYLICSEFEVSDVVDVSRHLFFSGFGRKTGKLGKTIVW